MGIGEEVVKKKRGKNEMKSKRVVVTSKEKRSALG